MSVHLFSPVFSIGNRDFPVKGGAMVIFSISRNFLPSWQGFITVINEKE